MKAECAIFAGAREPMTAVTIGDCDSQTVLHETNGEQSWLGQRIDRQALKRDLPKVIKLSLRSLGFAT